MSEKVLTPFKHQLNCASFLAKRLFSGAIFADIGTGKTVMALLNFQNARKYNPNLKLLVICPISLIHAAWETDIKKWTDFKFHSLRRKDWLPADIYAINFESVITSSMQEKIRQLTLRDNFMIVIDESQKMKNHKSAISKTLLQMANMFQYRVIMSGCPAPNGYSEYWSQMRFIDPTIFHKSPYAFLSEYFHLARGNQVMDEVPKNKFAMREVFSNGFKYAITKEKKESLLSKITPYCFFANIDECLDLPSVTTMVQEAFMTPELRKVYNELKNDLVTEIQGLDIAAPIALTKLMKLRELTGGFVITADGQTLVVDCPKIEVLKDILESAGTQQVIIWTNFTWEANRIIQELGRDTCAVLNGSVQNKEAEILDFQQGRKQYLIAHPKSGGAGLTFVNSSLMVDYSLDYSFDNMIQTQGRFRRPGQTATHLNRIRIIMKDSIDEIILGALEGKYTENEIVRIFLAKNQGGVKCVTG